MTKKDYEVIATVIRKARRGDHDCLALDELLQKLCDYFAYDNVCFNRARFLAACDPAEAKK